MTIENQEPFVKLRYSTLRINDIDLLDKIILDYLAGHQNGYAPKQIVMADLMGVSPRTIRRRIGALINLGYVKKDGKRGERRQYVKYVVLI
jgi:DNA-binding Lrp family transcriptional regulator